MHPLGLQLLFVKNIFIALLNIFLCIYSYISIFFFFFMKGIAILVLIAPKEKKNEAL